MVAQPLASLEVTFGLPGSEIITIATSPIVLGNSASADVFLDNEFVSRRHMQIRRDADVFYITDLGSTNGTSINGNILHPQQDYVLRHGDRVSIGDYVLLVFRESGRVTSPGINRTPSPQYPKTLPGHGSNDIIVDSGTRKVSVNGREIRGCTKKEFDILECLYQKRWQAVPRSDLAVAGWPEWPDHVNNTDIDQYIRRIRRKIEQDPSSPVLVATVRGFGYMLQ